MKNVAGCLVLCLMLSFLWGCGSNQKEVELAPDSPPVRNIQVRVVDVSNSTGEIYDVDVIGMMWSSLDGSLRKRGLLWNGSSVTPPLRLEATITEYRKGNWFARNLVPFVGSTVLVVKGELKEGDRVIASAETKRSISLGNESLTIGAWRKIFALAAEDIVSELTKKL